MSANSRLDLIQRLKG